MPLTPSTGWVATPVRGVAINRNGGSPCVGMLGRHDPVRSISPLLKPHIRLQQANSSNIISVPRNASRKTCRPAVSLSSPGFNPGLLA